MVFLYVLFVLFILVEVYKRDKFKEENQRCNPKEKMVTEMKFEIMSRKTIKPSIPTPHQHRTFSLSLLDQIFPPIYSSTVFFYSSNPNEKGNSITSQVLEQSSRLQNSLSKTLVHFYPMAGRLKDTASVECNDQGAYFVEAQVSCSLVDFLIQPNIELLSHFSPIIDPYTTQLASDSMLLIQLTAFSCGGIAIAVCPSHKIMDGSSLFSFLQSWTVTSRGYGEVVIPEFIGGSLLPPRDLPIMPNPKVNFQAKKCITRRFVFDAIKISSLKAKTAGAIGQRSPTNVEIVLALILKCAMAASKSISSRLRPLLLSQAVDLRKRMVPPLPENSIGNLIWQFLVFSKDSELELHDLVAKMREGLIEFCNEKANKFKGDEGFQMVCESLKERGELMKRMDITIYRCTSLCKLPLYEMDFGWGKPMWITNNSSNYFENLIVLMDTKQGGGIEAWVTLEEREMEIFQRSKGLLEFASFNPSAFVKQSRI